MSNLYDLPKDMLIKLVTTIREEAKKDYEKEIFLLKEEKRMYREISKTNFYYCSYGKCNAMWATNGKSEDSYSGCSDFDFCECADGMSLCYCDKHKCSICS